MDTHDLVAEYEQLMVDMKEMAERALRIVRILDPDEAVRAKAYWFGHIITNIDNDHAFLGREMCTMQDSFEAIQSAKSNKIEDAEDDE